MNHLTAFLASLSLLTSASGQDKPAGGKREERRGPPSPDEFLKNYDLNQDQKISKEEFGVGERISRLDPASREKIFLRLDKDGDGFISREELKGMSPKHRRNPLAKADLDKDGRISREEFASHGPFAEMSEERRELIFDRLDHDADGFLDREDDRKSGGKGGRGERRVPRFKMKGLDLDGSGFLSWDEFKDAPAVLTMPAEERRQIFQRLDTDKNGELSQQELRSHFEGRLEGHEKKPRPKK